MSETPKLIKEFSKESNQEERDLLAQEIKKERREGFQKRASDLEKKEQNENQLEKTKQELNALRDQLEEISGGGFLRKIIDFGKLKKIRVEMGIKEQQIDELGSSVGKPIYESTDFRQKTEERLNNFYNNETERWVESEYTAEDVKKYFNPEHLASLSIEEYELLLQRFPSQMVTHVTRQGVRDHLGAVQHFAGLNKYWDGFKTTMKNGRKLKHQLSLSVGEISKDEALEKFLKRGFVNLDGCESEEQALAALDEFSDIKSLNHDGSMWDFTSIHVATEEVADAHYGAEKYNEIFFTFPSALIASQYAYSGQLDQVGGDYHNNQWIWSKDEEGMSIDAGVVFIPKNTPVSPRNGSRYELDADMNPKENTELINNLTEKVIKPEFQTLISEMIPYLGNLLTNAKRVVSLKEEDVLYDDREIWPILTKFKLELEKILEINDPKITKMFFSYNSLSSLKERSDQEINVDRAVKDILYLEGYSFEPAKDSVRAEEYWESYFMENPELRPSKIVYYEQDSPTEALRKWRANKKLRGSSKELTQKFEENRVSAEKTELPEHLSIISKRFKDLAKRAISQYYQKKT
jgi:hypothetical protein